MISLSFWVGVFIGYFMCIFVFSMNYLIAKYFVDKRKKEFLYNKTDKEKSLIFDWQNLSK